MPASDLDIESILVAPIELLALAAPIIKWFKEDNINLMLLLDRRGVFINYNHEYEDKSTTRIGVRFTHEQVYITTDATYNSEYFESFTTDLSDPNFIDNIIQSILRVRALGSRAAVFKDRDEKQ